MTSDRPDPAPLAAGAGARYRRAERAVSERRFAVLRSRVAAGFEWAVGGLVTDDRGSILLVYEDGRWLLPGGAVEGDECLEVAVRREVREETGLPVTVGDLLVVTDKTVTDGDDRLSFTFAIYEADPETTVLVPNLRADESVDAVAWTPTIPAATLDRPLITELRE